MPLFACSLLNDFAPLPETSGASGLGAGAGADGDSALCAVALGGAHTCARGENGSLWCWGDNSQGQLGTSRSKSSPAQVAALGVSVVEAALGGGHSCARKEDGTVWCWGDNSYGQLGDGTDLGTSSSPVLVSALGVTAVAVALGTSHTCARKGDGSLWCWGDNSQGQLGDGTLVARSSPVLASALGATAVAVALGTSHTCARKGDGSLWCWGDNSQGQLGDGTTAEKGSPVKLPVEAALLGTTAVEVAAGVFHTCARKADGSLWCWGRNAYGQLGDGTLLDRASPVQVAALGTMVVGVALGGHHSCARKADGSLWCWGRNAYGQLGDGTLLDRASPVQVAALGTTVVGLALGGYHSCARKHDGTLWCWGRNDYGQLGDGTLLDQSSPVPVPVPLCP
jgi:alpha-tubulin suppressor-like RCC1 family protein